MNEFKDMDYDKVYKMLQAEKLERYIDMMLLHVKTFENVLTWHESVLNYVAHDLFGNSQTKEALMKCFKVARDSCNDPVILAKRESLSGVRIDLYERDEFYSPNDDGYVRKASVYTNV